MDLWLSTYTQSSRDNGLCLVESAMTCFVLWITPWVPYVPLATAHLLLEPLARILHCRPVWLQSSRANIKRPPEKIELLRLIENNKSRFRVAPGRCGNREFHTDPGTGCKAPLKTSVWKCNALILAQIRSISRHDNVKMSSIFRPASDTASSWPNLLAEWNRFRN